MLSPPESGGSASLPGARRAPRAQPLHPPQPDQQRPCQARALRAEPPTPVINLAREKETQAAMLQLQQSAQQMRGQQSLRLQLPRRLTASCEIPSRRAAAAAEDAGVCRARARSRRAARAVAAEAAGLPAESRADQSAGSQPAGSEHCARSPPRRLTTWRWRRGPRRRRCSCSSQPSRGASNAEPALNTPAPGYSPARDAQPPQQTQVRAGPARAAAAPQQPPQPAATSVRGPAP